MLQQCSHWNAPYHSLSKLLDPNPQQLSDVCFGITNNLSCGSIGSGFADSTSIMVSEFVLLNTLNLAHKILKYVA